jgi:uncharacterized protein
MRRQDIEFDADGTTLRGWFYPALDTDGPAPVVVFGHGFASVKEMYLDKYADSFAAAGLNAVVFDHPNFGASDGEPRQEIDPWAQIRAYRDAITFATTLDEVDEKRIGAWGTSYSGGHAIVVAAIDRRVGAVVVQAPMVRGLANLRSLVRADLISAFRQQFDEDRLSRFQGGTPSMVAVVTQDPSEPAALPTSDSWEYFDTARKIAPTFRNEVTMRSVEMFGEYEPGFYLPSISPTPLMMIVGVHDHLTPAHIALEAYETAREPKELVLLDGGHFSAYIEAFDETSSAATRWFTQHLTGN